MRKLSVLVMLLCVSVARGATINAVSPSFADVSAAVASASNGDIVTIPAGAATWGAAEKLTYAKNIQLIGAGMDETQATPRSTNATIITVTNTTGAFINATFSSSDNLCRVSGIVINMTTQGASYLLTFSGKAYMRNVLGVVKGGLRVDHIRFRAQGDVTNVITGKASVITWGTITGSTDSYITGSYDHNYHDFLLGNGGSEVENFSCPGSPDGSLPHSFGQWSWGQLYANGTDRLDVVFVEDNIFHRGGTNLGTLGGGARLIVRYNTSGGSMNGHGMDTGNNMGATSWEWYNNWIDRSWKMDSSFSGYTIRGGPSVLFNNRFTSYGFGSQPPDSRFEFDRVTGTVSGVVGPAHGKNFFDENERGPITKNGVNFSVVSTPADTRLGSVYATGTGCVINTPNKSYTLTGLSGMGVADAWNSFVIINTDTTEPESQGGQGLLTGPQTASFALIKTSTNATPTQVTIAGRNAPDFNLTETSHWEIRRVKTFFCIPGAGKIPTPMNGGDNNNIVPNTGDPDTTGAAFIAANGNGKHKYWCAQPGFGIWLKGNLRRDFSTTPWNGTNVATTSLENSDSAEYANGGVHDEELPTNRNNDGSGGGAYPTQPNDAVHLRVGAHWQAPGYNEGLNMGDVGAPTQAYGSTYPNPLVSGAPPAGSVDYTGNLAFGNQIIGDPPATSIVTVHNGTAVTVTIASVAYSPSVFSGPTDSFAILPGDSFTVAVSFTPTAETVYSGTVTFNADSGVNVMSASGTGVAPAGDNRRPYPVYLIIKKILSKWIP